ncbi:unnamed protein product [Euphydryas editha]|uniref:unspecific monooxygenase n=1 Tax=Euphydryas editha TaxID=104508 RepID=A0AAU9V8S9_EUPED|nr:unnamed protein product [Euphydryas editha]
MNPDGTPKEVELEMDLTCMIAQVFAFFAAGFETTSSATSCLLHELAYNQEIQKNIQKEIDEVLMKYDNRLCYEAVAEMTLLNLALKESLRMYPPLKILTRVCANQYKISQLDVTIDSGVSIIIPLHALQNDGKHFDKPEQFRPERFANNQNIKSSYVYMPFGMGPRNCIGYRLGQMQSLAGVAALLQNFSVEPSEKTRRKLKLDLGLNKKTVKDGVPLKLLSRIKLP